MDNPRLTVAVNGQRVNHSEVAGFLGMDYQDYLERATLAVGVMGKPIKIEVSIEPPEALGLISKALKGTH